MNMRDCYGDEFDVRGFLIFVGHMLQLVYSFYFIGGCER